MSKAGAVLAEAAACRRLALAAGTSKGLVPRRTVLGRRSCQCLSVLGGWPLVLEEGQRSLPVAVYMFAAHTVAAGRTRRSVARRRFGLGQHTVEQRRPARRPAQHTSALEELRTSSSAVPYRRWC